MEEASLYIPLAIKIIDEDTILLYVADSTESGSFEVTVDLSTGQSTIKDYRS